MLQIAEEGKVVDVITSEHGVKFIVDGAVAGLSGEKVVLRTVWIVEQGRDTPRFVTAYPIG